MGTVCVLGSTGVTMLGGFMFSVIEVLFVCVALSESLCWCGLSVSFSGPECLGVVWGSEKIKIEREEKDILEKVVPKFVLGTKIQSLDDWNNVREEILNSRKEITLRTIDSAILSVCIASKNYELGLAVIGKYFRLFYLSNFDKKISESDENDVYNLYLQLRKIYKVFDCFTCENIIHALSITRHWKDCYELLNEIKVAGEPGSSAISVIAAACFKNNAAEQGWSLLKETAERNRLPTNIAYLSYIEACEQTQKLSDLEKLFEYFHTHDIKCNEEVINKITSTYKNSNPKIVIVKKSGNCINCNNVLRNIELSEEEFKDLKTTIFNNVIVGSNVFYKSTPAELEKFKKFILNMKNYDVVIDGLNVAYSIGTKQSPSVFAFLVKSVVKHFVDKNKKVLVLGRTHMQKWSKFHWAYVTQNADTFLTETLSQDDPYLLYCALNCGKDTIIVSRDLMRGHAFKLFDVKLKMLFNRWLLQNQYQLVHVNEQGKVFFKCPLPYARTSQKVGNIWHVPFDDNLNNEMSDLKWLCLSISVELISFLEELRVE
ncbi:hypothetical protein FQA39_LY00540 [Lamprigera yunnana]|nr:hypothetical protein FQA39_LY00540 [Lamprigera yunnana]